MGHQPLVFVGRIGQEGIATFQQVAFAQQAAGIGREARVEEVLGQAVGLQAGQAVTVGYPVLGAQVFQLDELRRAGWAVL